MIFPIFVDFSVSFCERAFFFSFGQLPPKVFNFSLLGVGLGFEASFIFFDFVNPERIRFCLFQDLRFLVQLPLNEGCSGPLYSLRPLYFSVP
jgi:hypothetical protein